jgi:hypothetical protein
MEFLTSIMKVVKPEEELTAEGFISALYQFLFFSLFLCGSTISYMIDVTLFRIECDAVDDARRQRVMEVWRKKVVALSKMQSLFRNIRSVSSHRHKLPQSPLCRFFSAIVDIDNCVVVIVCYLLLVKNMKHNSN